MKAVVATCLVLALCGCSDASRVESLVYETQRGSVRCIRCSNQPYCSVCKKRGESLSCQHSYSYTSDVKHSIKKISAGRKWGVDNVWVVEMKIHCPLRGDLWTKSEWSYRDGEVKYLRKADD